MNLHQWAERAVNAAEGKYDARRGEAEKIIFMARSLQISAGRYAVERTDADGSCATAASVADKRVHGG